MWSTRRICSSERNASAITVLPWPDWKYSARRLLVAAHVRLEDRALGLHRARAASRSPCSARTSCASSCSARPRRRSSTARARGTSARRRASSPRAASRASTSDGVVGDVEPRRASPAARASIQRASAIASRRVGADEARRARDAVGEHVGAGSSRRPVAPRVIEAVRPPSVCASGTCTVSVARPVSTTRAVVGRARTRRARSRSGRPRPG